MSDTSLEVEVPARRIPPPTHLSHEAKAQLGFGGVSLPEWPALEDMEGWRRLIASMDEMGEAVLSSIADQVDAHVEELEIEGVRIFAITPTSATDDAVYIDIHGGSLLWGGGASCRAMGLITAGQVGAKVRAVDYRMPPDHPYPRGLDDCVTAYRALLHESSPEKIIIGGASAGGNLAAATVLRSRDAGLPLPAGLVLLTPEIDLTEGGDSFRTLLGVDTTLTGSLMPANLLYAGGHHLTDPYVSPLFGDFSSGFPPTFIQSGTRDLFLSNAALMHRALRRADVEAELHIFDAATHAMFMAGPEKEDYAREIRRFVDRIWGRNPV